MFLLHLVSKKYIFSLITCVRHYTTLKINLKASLTGNKIIGKLTNTKYTWRIYIYLLNFHNCQFITKFILTRNIKPNATIYTISRYLTSVFSDHEDQRSSWIVEGSELGSSPGEGKDGIPLPPTKPRIWSMAELAVSKSSYVGCG